MGPGGIGRIFDRSLLTTVCWNVAVDTWVCMIMEEGSRMGYSQAFSYGLLLRGTRGRRLKTSKCDDLTIVECGVHERMGRLRGI